MIHVLILWGLVVLALSIAFLVERRRKRVVEAEEAEAAEKPDAEKDADKQDADKPDGEKPKGENNGKEKKTPDRPEYQVALGFVASSYGLLLGLLVAFGANHHADVRQQAQNEADSMTALWSTVAVYPTAIRDRTQHQIMCYMRSVRDDDWPSMERGNAQESDRTGRFGDQLRLTISDLPQTGGREGSAYGRAEGIMTDATKSREQLLFFTQPRVPTVLWAVIYVGAFLLFLLIALHYAGRPTGRLVSLGAVVTLLTVVVTTLSFLDQPFGVGARVGPTSMQHAIELLNFQNKTTGVFGPCAKPSIT